VKEEIAALVRYRLQKGVFSREMSQDFHRAFELRQSADYRVVRAPSVDQARETLARAAAFVQSINGHLSR
jgi:uncharacterized protein (UPF0332 family)